MHICCQNALYHLPYGTSILFQVKFSNKVCFILLIIEGCSILKQTIWPRNHTSHKKNYFYEFVANVLRDNIGILIFDLHGGCQRPHTIQRPHTLALWDGPNIEVKCQSVRSLYGVQPLTASMEVKNNHAYVTTQRILYKFIEVNFYVGCMVWP